MTSILVSKPPIRLLGTGENVFHRESVSRIQFFENSNSDSQFHTLANGGPRWRQIRDYWAVCSGKSENRKESDGGESDEDDVSSANSDTLREELERIVGTDDSSFSGIDLATPIWNKFGRSYDFQLIKKEFMGRNLLAMNVMWKYMEQRSFPLTEEEYILRLDDVTTNLRCWGAVSHVRNSLKKLREKERPQIGKAVSIFIDMDESGGRAKELIYK